ncbi:MAG: amino acid transporter [Planctomycetia bacterium]|nr:amino acid transporter [Planctomycetia bacterium]
MTSPSPRGNAGHADGRHYAWWLIMCLCGVDYFSTLGYQPSIAFEGAGTLAPLATLVLVCVTLFGALPIYRHVAGETPDGVGSIGMIERMFRGWTGKIVVLVLIGFAATDFVITKTLSAADAAAHLISNPLYVGHVPAWMQGQMAVTMFLLVLLGGMFLRGYGEVVGVATLLVVAFLGLTFIVVVASLMYLVGHPSLLQHWLAEITSGRYRLEHAPLAGSGPWIAAGISLLVFPKLALGLSGFETGVLHIHLVRGTAEHPDDEAARVANTKRMLLVAALIMSFFLVASSLITGTDTLIPAEELRLEPVKGKAMDRALAYIAHGESPHPICPLFGHAFGTAYDVATILILWFAGASAMGGLLNMVPRYLPRFGMAPEWAGAYRPLVIAFTIINLVVTLAFRADVSAQGGAYATGVLVLMTSACIASLIHELKKTPEPHHALGLLGQRVGFGLITLVFVYTMIANIMERPDGIIIASIFITCVMLISFTSRAWRSDELRLKEFRFADDAERMLWTDILLEGAFRVLVPHRPGSRSLADKEQEIRRKHRIPDAVPIVFLEVHYGDVSEFENAPVISVRQEGNRFIIVARDVVSVSHTIAQIAMEMSKGGAPLDVVFGWSKGGSLKLALDYVLFGQGDVPNRVVDLLDKAITDPARRPTVIVG